MNKGDTVKIIQRCGGHIEGMEPELYEVGETYTVQKTLMARVPYERGALNKKEPALMLRADARFAVPVAAVEPVPANPIADLQAWAEAMKRPQANQKPRCTSCYSILSLEERKQNGCWCASCM